MGQNELFMTEFEHRTALHSVLNASIDRRGRRKERKEEKRKKEREKIKTRKLK